MLARNAAAAKMTTLEFSFECTDDGPARSLRACLLPAIVAGMSSEAEKIHREIAEATQAAVRASRHGEMLADSIRTDAYQRAISDRIKPGDVVLDLGSGTGFLACLACAAGASKVYAIEQDSRILSVAKEVIRRNGYEAKVHWLEGTSFEVGLQEKVDVVLSEIIGSFGLDEGIQDSLEDARIRFLKPGGIMIPESIRLYLAPIEAADLYHNMTDIWRKGVCGIDYTSALSLCLQTPHHRFLQSTMLLGGAGNLPEIRFTEPSAGKYDGRATLTCDRDGQFHGLALWFSSDLSPEIRLTNDPSAPHTHWSQGVMLLPEPLAVRAGESFEVSLYCSGNGLIWRWEISSPARGYSFAASNFEMGSNSESQIRRQD